MPLPPEKLARDRPGRQWKSLGRQILVISAAVSALVAAGSGNVAEAEVVDGTARCEVALVVDGVEIDLRRHDSTVISDAIELKRDSLVSYRVKSDLPISGHAVTIDLAGVKLPVDLSGPDIEGTTWSGKAKVSDYFEIGPGLYRITWQSGNGKSCAATALVKVEGNPFESLPGITATTFMVIGGVGFTLTVGARALSKIVVTLRVFVGGRIKRGQRRTWADRLLPGTKWSLKDTIRGTLLATAFGIGYSVFVQQAAIAPLSFELTVKVMLPSLLIAPGLSSLKLLDRVIYQSEQR